LRQRACRPSWPRAPLQSPPIAPAGEPASSRGVGGYQTVTRLTPALCPSTDTSAARPLPVTGATIGLEATSLEVPFRPRGFSPPRRFSPRDGSQVCCTLQPAMGFASFRIVKSVSQLRGHSPQALPPLEGHHHLKAATRSPAPVPPWRSSSISTQPHRCRWDRARTEAVTFEALIREVVLDGAACCHSAPSCSFLGFHPLRGAAAAVSRPPALSPGREAGSARRR